MTSTSIQLTGRYVMLAWLHHIRQRPISGISVQNPRLPVPGRSGHGPHLVHEILARASQYVYILSIDAFHAG